MLLEHIVMELDYVCTCMCVVIGSTCRSSGSMHSACDRQCNLWFVGLDSHG